MLPTNFAKYTKTDANCKHQSQGSGTHVAVLLMLMNPVAKGSMIAFYMGLVKLAVGACNC